MFSLTVAFPHTTAQWALLFKTEEKAREAGAIFANDADGTVTDDFGQTLIAPAGMRPVMMFENLDLSKLGRIEMALHLARVQADGQKRAQTDPVLNSLARPGPAIVTPMGLNGGQRLS